MAEQHCSNTHEFDFNWDQVVTAFWQRYPNPYSSHVLSEDVIDRRIKDGKIYTKRLFSKKGKAPSFAKRFTDSDILCVVEESVLDLESRTLTSYARNIDMVHVMAIDEKCVIQESEFNPLSTSCDRQMWSSSQITGLSNLISKYGLRQYKTQIEKTNEGFNNVIQKLFCKVLDTETNSTTSEVKNTDKIARTSNMHVMTDRSEKAFANNADNTSALCEVDEKRIQKKNTHWKNTYKMTVRKKSTLERNAIEEVLPKVQRKQYSNEEQIQRVPMNGKEVIQTNSDEDCNYKKHIVENISNDKLIHVDSGNKDNFHEKSIQTKCAIKKPNLLRQTMTTIHGKVKGIIFPRRGSDVVFIEQTRDHVNRLTVLGKVLDKN